LTNILEGTLVRTNPHALQVLIPERKALAVLKRKPVQTVSTFKKQQKNKRAANTDVDVDTLLLPESKVAAVIMEASVCCHGGRSNLLFCNKTDIKAYLGSGGWLDGSVCAGECGIRIGEYAQKKPVREGSLFYCKFDFQIYKDCYGGNVPSRCHFALCSDCYALDTAASGSARSSRRSAGTIK
jgi:hypothetical protein